jgi:hypothetical protein
VVISVETPFTGTEQGSTDRDYWLPAEPISGGPDGFRVQGAIDIRYTAPPVESFPQGVLFEFESSSGEAPHGGWLPATAADEERLIQIPVYAILQWPQQQDHQVRLSIAAAHAQATVHRIYGEVTLERAGQLLA